MNKQIWELYKTSLRGQEMIDLFSFYADFTKEKIEVFDKKLETIFNRFNKESDIGCFYLINDNIFLSNLYIEEGEEVTAYFTRFINSFDLWMIEESADGGLMKSSKPKDQFIKKGEYRKICGVIDNISLNLYLLHPAAFFPFLFRERFDVFMKNCDALGIDVPNVPNSADKKNRIMYYNHLCEVLYEFSDEYNLSPEELCACIYDFSPMLQEESKIKYDLPEPTNIWLTGADKSDYKTTLQKLTPEVVSVWACNEATKRGDIVVIYCLSPHSFIHSIWRANSDGVANPFNYYYSRATVTNPIQIPPISYAELKSDEYWSNVPIVRKNLQGINGVRITAKDYNELLRLISAKGFDVSVLPKLYSPELNIDAELKTEKDVEEKLLIPLLNELGYTENDWTRQLSQKAGRGLKAIPDFVFFPKGEKHFQNAPFVLEAKFSMNSSNERINAFNQALSYCKMMSAQLLGLCDRERLIIYRKKDNTFDRFSPIFEKHWGSLKNPEVFSELKKIIGREEVFKLG